MAHHRHVVADEDVAEAEGIAQPDEQVHDLRPHRDVERGDRLIEEHHARLDRQRPGDAQALSLAAGELVRQPVRERRREADHVQQLRHPAGPTARVAVQAVDEEHLIERRPRGPPRVERRVRVLEHELDAPPLLAELPPVEGGEVNAVEPDGARGGFLEPHEQLREGRLAAPRLADDAQRLPRRQRRARPR